MHFIAAASASVIVWWVATGIILYLDGLPIRTYRVSLALASAAALLAIIAVNQTADRTTEWSAYTAFACAIVIWGWAELSFLTGFITGPRRVGCSAGCRGWRHAWHATQAILYHELVILGFGVILLLVTRGRLNRVAVEAFAILWTMRLSAKLNLFLGVRNLGEKFLPEHLAYLASFLRRRSMNPLFPVSVLCGGGVTVLVSRAAFSAEATPHSVAAAGLLSALLGLAVVEHVFMMLPVSLDGLWRWGFSSRAAPDVNPGS